FKYSDPVNKQKFSQYKHQPNEKDFFKIFDTTESNFGTNINIRQLFDTNLKPATNQTKHSLDSRFKQSVDTKNQKKHRKHEFDINSSKHLNFDEFFENRNTKTNISSIFANQTTQNSLNQTKKIGSKRTDNSSFEIIIDDLSSSDDRTISRIHRISKLNKHINSKSDQPPTSHNMTIMPHAGRNLKRNESTEEKLLRIAVCTYVTNKLLELINKISGKSKKIVAVLNLPAGYSGTITSRAIDNVIFDTVSERVITASMPISGNVLLNFLKRFGIVAGSEHSDEQMSPFILAEVKKSIEDSSELMDNLIREMRPSARNFNNASRRQYNHAALPMLNVNVEELEGTLCDSDLNLANLNIEKFVESVKNISKVAAKVANDVVPPMLAESKKRRPDEYPEKGKLVNMQNYSRYIKDQQPPTNKNEITSSLMLEGLKSAAIISECILKKKFNVNNQRTADAIANIQEIFGSDTNSEIDIVSRLADVIAPIDKLKTEAEDSLLSAVEIPKNMNFQTMKDYIKTVLNANESSVGKRVDSLEFLFGKAPYGDNVDVIFSDDASEELFKIAVDSKNKNNNKATVTIYSKQFLKLIIMSGQSVTYVGRTVVPMKRLVFNLEGLESVHKIFNSDGWLKLIANNINENDNIAQFLMQNTEIMYFMSVLQTAVGDSEVLKMFNKDTLAKKGSCFQDVLMLCIVSFKGFAPRFLEAYENETIVIQNSLTTKQFRGITYKPTEVSFYNEAILLAQLVVAEGENFQFVVPDFQQLVAQTDISQLITKKTTKYLPPPSHGVTAAYDAAFAAIKKYIADIMPYFLTAVVSQIDANNRSPANISLIASKNPVFVPSNDTLVAFGLNVEIINRFISKALLDAIASQLLSNPVVASIKSDVMDFAASVLGYDKDGGVTIYNNILNAIEEHYTSNSITPVLNALVHRVMNPAEEIKTTTIKPMFGFTELSALKLTNPIDKNLVQPVLATTIDVTNAKAKIISQTDFKQSSSNPSTNKNFSITYSHGIAENNISKLPEILSTLADETAPNVLNSSLLMQELENVEQLWEIFSKQNIVFEDFDDKNEQESLRREMINTKSYLEGQIPVIRGKLTPTISLLKQLTVSPNNDDNPIPVVPDFFNMKAYICKLENENITQQQLESKVQSVSHWFNKFKFLFDAAESKNVYGEKVRIEFSNDDSAEIFKATVNEDKSIILTIYTKPFSSLVIAGSNDDAAYNIFNILSKILPVLSKITQNDVDKDDEFWQLMLKNPKVLYFILFSQAGTGNAFTNSLENTQELLISCIFNVKNFAKNMVAIASNKGSKSQLSTKYPKAFKFAQTVVGLNPNSDFPFLIDTYLQPVEEIELPKKIRFELLEELLPNKPIQLTDSPQNFSDVSTTTQGLNNVKLMLPKLTKIPNLDGFASANVNSLITEAVNRIPGVFIDEIGKGIEPIKSTLLQKDIIIPSNVEIPVGADGKISIDSVQKYFEKLLGSEYNKQGKNGKNLVEFVKKFKQNWHQKGITVNFVDGETNNVEMFKMVVNEDKTTVLTIAIKKLLNLLTTHKANNSGFRISATGLEYVRRIFLNYLPDQRAGMIGNVISADDKIIRFMLEKYPKLVGFILNYQLVDGVPGDMNVLNSVDKGEDFGHFLTFFTLNVAGFADFILEYAAQERKTRSVSHKWNKPVDINFYQNTLAIARAVSDAQKNNKFTPSIEIIPQTPLLPAVKQPELKNEQTTLNIIQTYVFFKLPALLKAILDQLNAANPAPINIKSIAEDANQYLSELKSSVLFNNLELEEIENTVNNHMLHVLLETALAMVNNNDAAFKFTVSGVLANLIGAKKLHKENKNITNVIEIVIVSDQQYKRTVNDVILQIKANSLVTPQQKFNEYVQKQAKNIVNGITNFVNSDSFLADLGQISKSSAISIQTDSLDNEILGSEYDMDNLNRVIIRQLLTKVKAINGKTIHSIIADKAKAANESIMDANIVTNITPNANSRVKKDEICKNGQNPETVLKTILAECEKIDFTNLQAAINNAANFNPDKSNITKALLIDYPTQQQLDLKEFTKSTLPTAKNILNTAMTYMDNIINNKVFDESTLNILQNASNSLKLANANGGLLNFYVGEHKNRREINFESFLTTHFDSVFNGQVKINEKILKYDFVNLVKFIKRKLGKNHKFAGFFDEAMLNGQANGGIVFVDTQNKDAIKMYEYRLVPAKIGDTVKDISKLFIDKKLFLSLLFIFDEQGNVSGVNEPGIKAAEMIFMQCTTEYFKNISSLNFNVPKSNDDFVENFLKRLKDNVTAFAEFALLINSIYALKKSGPSDDVKPVMLDIFSQNKGELFEALMILGTLYFDNFAPQITDYHSVFIKLAPNLAQVAKAVNGLNAKRKAITDKATEYISQKMPAVIAAIESVNINVKTDAANESFIEPIKKAVSSSITTVSFADDKDFSSIITPEILDGVILSEALKTLKIFAKGHSSSKIHNVLSTIVAKDQNTLQNIPMQLGLTDFYYLANKGVMQPFISQITSSVSLSMKTSGMEHNLMFKSQWQKQRISKLLCDSNLENNGFLCYANSVIQIFYSIPEFRQTIISTNMDNVPDGLAIKQLQKVFFEMSLGKTSSLQSFVNAMGYSNNEQQDVVEFMLGFLNLIESQLRDYGKYAAVDFLKSCTEGFLTTNVVMKAYPGIYNSKSVYKILSLAIQDKGSINSSLSKFTAPVLMPWNLSDETQAEAINTMKIDKLPNLLMIQENRFNYVFNYVGVNSVKNNGFVVVPEVIDLQDYVNPVMRGKLIADGGTEYILYAMVLHSGIAAAGPTSSGHYVSEIKNGKNITLFDASSGFYNVNTFTSNLRYDKNSDSFTPYVLVYIRKNAISKLFASNPDKAPSYGDGKSVIPANPLHVKIPHTSPQTPKINQYIVHEPVRRRQRVSIYSGLRNPGSLCYLNTFIQQLYRMSAFRNMIININTNSFNNASSTIALRSVFLEMQTKESDSTDTYKRVQSEPIVESFEWEREKKAAQHDIHEFSRFFLELLQTQISNSGNNSGAVDFFKNFNGAFMSSITSANHSPINTNNVFGDLSLSIKGSSTVAGCLEKFTSKTPMQGGYTFEDNITEAAWMTTRFLKLPNILYIQLNRFRFALAGPTKLMQHIEVPTEINFEEYMATHGFAGAKEKEVDKDTIYVLFAIAIHSGTPTNGHYVSRIRIGNKWYEFNDGRVYEISDDTVLPDNDDDDRTPYILTYIRKSAVEELFAGNINEAPRYGVPPQMPSKPHFDKKSTNPPSKPTEHPTPNDPIKPSHKLSEPLGFYETIQNHKNAVEVYTLAAVDYCIEYITESLENGNLEKVVSVDDIKTAITAKKADADSKIVNKDVKTYLVRNVLLKMTIPYSNWRQALSLTKMYKNDRVKEIVSCFDFDFECTSTEIERAENAASASLSEKNRIDGDILAAIEERVLIERSKGKWKDYINILENGLKDKPPYFEYLMSVNKLKDKLPYFEYLMSVDEHKNKINTCISAVVKEVISRLADRLNMSDKKHAQKSKVESADYSYMSARNTSEKIRQNRQGTGFDQKLDFYLTVAVLDKMNEKPSSWRKALKLDVAAEDEYVEDIKNRFEFAPRWDAKKFEEISKSDLSTDQSKNDIEVLIEAEIHKQVQEARQNEWKDALDKYDGKLNTKKSTKDKDKAANPNPEPKIEKHKTPKPSAKTENPKLFDQIIKNYEEPVKQYVTAAVKQVIAHFT
ncbi:MAG: hypothetical protein LBU04_08425, partial [Christensenellaceae bacterium]|nr:hypothetical protein [Christensenellaceae bacterium]